MSYKNPLPSLNKNEGGTKMNEGILKLIEDLYLEIEEG